MALLKSGRLLDDRDDSALAGTSRRGAKPSDPMLPTKQKARHRLIGASVLALAAVVGLPMLLDGERKPVSSDVTITIPSNEKPNKPEASATPRSATPAPETAAASSPPAAPVTAVAPITPAPVVAPARTPEQTPSNASQAPTQAKESAKALAALEGRDVKPDRPKGEPAKKEGQFALQLGAFSSEAKAREFQNKAKAAGISTYTERIKTDAGERFRVRAGPFSSRESAEAARARAASHGVTDAALVGL